VSLLANAASIAHGIKQPRHGRALVSVRARTTIGSGWTRHEPRASNKAHEDPSRHHHARRPAPRDALALAELRALPAARATGVRGRGHPLGPRRVERRAAATRAACGHKGATIQHPGWGGADIGFLPFSNRDASPIASRLSRYARPQETKLPSSASRFESLYLLLNLLVISPYTPSILPSQSETCEITTGHPRLSANSDRVPPG
jgi:hypothetical protein